MGVIYLVVDFRKFLVFGAVQDVRTFQPRMKWNLILNEQFVM